MHRTGNPRRKTRERSIISAVEERLHAYMANVVRDLGCEAYRVGGTDDHVHLAVRMSRTTTVANLIEKAKTTTSKWMKAQDGVGKNFGWQHGYGAFSVSPSHLEALIHYIDNQHDHHVRVSFQDEFRGLLRKYRIEVDERYLPPSIPTF